jgi:hypothetical protein
MILPEEAWIDLAYEKEALGAPTTSTFSTLSNVLGF